MPNIASSVELMSSRMDQVMRDLTGCFASTERVPRARRHALILLAAGLTYGAVMGTFGGIGISRLPQIACSAIKAPLLLLTTFALSLPSFFVLNTLFGLRADFHKTLRALVSAQAAVTVILASLAPFTALWYLSITDYQDAILFNAAMFAAASVGGQIALRRLYRPLIAANPKHAWMLRAWLVIFAFVGIQVGWVLRPYIGSPHMPTRFLRSDMMTNAYVSVGRLILEKLR